MNAAYSRDHSLDTRRSQERSMIGQQLVLAGKLTESQVTLILQTQQTRNLRFGETAIDLGLLTLDDLRIALARQYNYPYFETESGGLSAKLFAVAEPYGSQSEALRTLRSQLLLRWFADRRKSLAITSTRRGEQSAVLAANLAISFAQLGERVLLIDANLRDPQQHRLFGLGSAIGLSGLLSERSDTEGSLSAVPGFDDSLTVMCAGAVPPNPQELLNKVTFSYLVETAPRLFDIILIDTPPILDFADAQLVSALVGGCLLATHLNRTRVSDIEEVKRQLHGSHVEIVGAVVLD